MVNQPSDDVVSAPIRRCWLCGTGGLRRIKESTLRGDPTSRNFEISNADYGTTAAIDQCVRCGFCQCTDMVDVLKFYEDLEDPAYEMTRPQRARQKRVLLNRLPRPTAGANRLLDVGAGTGILVEEAIACGYDAIGVEPSRRFCARAKHHGLPVVQGVLPHPDLTGPYDLVTLVDVVEHVPDPLDLITQAARLLADDGVLVVVTPDRSSLLARIMGDQWWHYRVAHIGYFDPETLRFALAKAGLQQTEFHRPTWYFPLGYLVERVHRYLPRWARFKVPARLSDLVIPVHLRDSMMVCATKAQTRETAP